MANLPKRSVIFNEYITGVDAKPFFEDWYDVLRQGVGFAELVTYNISSKHIAPSVAEFLVDTEDGLETDTLEFIDVSGLHNGAIIRIGLADESRIVTLVHSNHLNLNGSNITLSTDFIVELKAVDDHWEVVNNYLSRVIQDKIKEVVETLEEDIRTIDEELVASLNTKADISLVNTKADISLVNTKADISAINSRADVNLANVTGTGWATVIRKGMPSLRYINVGAGVFHIPFDGFLWVWGSGEMNVYKQVTLSIDGGGGCRTKISLYYSV